ncbi:cupin domain-containing protein [Candidatus Saccharibacteria bacterium]|nr:cupin domain-containing protein [Candidatus Saccharibacteria bacterium]MBP9132001.1 cupin domain-containing protein [Candidatus Saccharibacteria bacterium]
MKIIKRPANSIDKEEAHGGSGARKLYATSDHLQSSSFEAMTYGYLPAGKTFDWHDHEDIEEIMVVIKGAGEVHDRDGVYEYALGDVFIYPANTEHKIHNPTDYEHEMIFVRVKL